MQDFYEISGKNGVKAKVTPYGATLVELWVPDKTGTLIDVVTGFDNIEAYKKSTSYFGATVGRNCNRIADAKCVIDGVEYQLEVNDNENNLHSGSNGLSERYWEVKEQKDNAITFTILDEDLSDDFPGNLTIDLTYTVTDDNALELHYHGTCDKDTICNFTNHTYFNLNGHNSGDCLQHTMTMNADKFIPVKSSHAIPTGEKLPVAGTPLDFTKGKTFAEGLEDGFEQIEFVSGYDHSFVINEGAKWVLQLVGDKTKIALEMTTDTPGVQVYSGNFVNDKDGKCGANYAARCAVALESNFYPNSVNQEGFESPIVKAGEVYDSVTAYRFYTV